MKHLIFALVSIKSRFMFMPEIKELFVYRLQQQLDRPESLFGRCKIMNSTANGLPLSIKPYEPSPEYPLPWQTATS